MSEILQRFLAPQEQAPAEPQDQPPAPSDPIPPVSRVLSDPSGNNLVGGLEGTDAFQIDPTTGRADLVPKATEANFASDIKVTPATGVNPYAPVTQATPLPKGALKTFNDANEPAAKDQYFHAANEALSQIASHQVDTPDDNTILGLLKITDDARSVSQNLMEAGKGYLDAAFQTLPPVLAYKFATGQKIDALEQLKSGAGAVGGAAGELAKGVAHPSYLPTVAKEVAASSHAAARDMKVMGSNLYAGTANLVDQGLPESEEMRLQRNLDAIKTAAEENGKIADVYKTLGVTPQAPLSEVTRFGMSQAPFAALPALKLGDLAATAADAAVEMAPKAILGTGRAARKVALPTAAGVAYASGHNLVGDVLLGAAGAKALPTLLGRTSMGPLIAKVIGLMADDAPAAQTSLARFTEAVDKAPWGTPIYEQITDGVKARIADLEHTEELLRKKNAGKFEFVDDPHYVGKLSGADAELGDIVAERRKLEAQLPGLEFKTKWNKIGSYALKVAATAHGEALGGAAVLAGLSATGAQPEDIRETAKEAATTGMLLSAPGLLNAFHAADVPRIKRNIATLKAANDGAIPADHPYADQAQEAFDSLRPEEQHRAAMIQGLAALSQSKPVMVLHPEDLKQALHDVEGINVDVAPDGYNGRDVTYVNSEGIGRGGADHELIHGTGLDQNPQVVAAAREMLASKDPAIQAKNAKALNQYREQLAQTNPDYVRNVDPVKELIAALGEDVLRDLPPEAIFGGKSGGGLISNWFADKFAQGGTTTSYGFHVTPKLRSALRDALYDLGKRASRMEGPKSEPSAAQEAPVEPGGSAVPEMAPEAGGAPSYADLTARAEAIKKQESEAAFPADVVAGLKKKGYPDNVIAELARQNKDKIPAMGQSNEPAPQQQQEVSKIPEIGAESPAGAGMEPLVSPAAKGKTTSVIPAVGEKATPVDYAAIRKTAEEDHLAKTPGKSKARARAAAKAGVMAMAQEHAARNPAGDLVTYRKDAFGRESISGRTLDPKDPFHRELIKAAGLTPAQMEKLQQLQARRGKAVTVDYLHAPEEEEASGISRKKEQEAANAPARVAGEAPIRRLTKVIVPEGITFNTASNKFTVGGFAPDKFLSNAAKLIPFAKNLGMKVHESVNDPEFLRDFQNGIENHRNDYTFSGKPIEGTPFTPTNPNPDYTPHIIPKDKADLLNAALHNTGARTGKTGLSAEQADKQILAQQNSPYFNPETGEANRVRDQFLKDNEGLLEPTYESVRPELVDNIRDGAAPDEQTMRESGFTGDRAALVAKGTPRQAFVAGGFKPPPSDEVIDRVRRAIIEHGGITVNLEGNEPVHGFVFAPSKETETTIPISDLTDTAIRAFADKYQSALEQDGAHLGGWKDGNNAVLDIAVVHPDELEALVRAKSSGQKAIYDLDSKHEIPTDELERKYQPAEIAAAQERAKTAHDASRETTQRELGGVQGQAGGGVPELQSAGARTPDLNDLGYSQSPQPPSRPPPGMGQWEYDQKRHIRRLKNDLVQYVKKGKQDDAQAQVLQEVILQRWKKLHAFHDQDPNPKLVIIGSGPAGMEAVSVAAYEDSYKRNINPVLYEAGPETGGQPKKSALIENVYNSEALGTMGEDMAQRSEQKALLNGANIKVNLGMKSLDFDPATKKLKLTLTDGTVRYPQHLVLATGIEETPMKVPGADLIISDRDGMRLAKEGYDGTVMIIGAGNSAGQAALGAIARGVQRVYMAVRSGSLEGMSGSPREMIGEERNIKVIKDEVAKVEKDGESGRLVTMKSGLTYAVKAIASFLGGKPSVKDLPKGLKIDQALLPDGKKSADYGKILTDENFETNIPGLYVAGDARSGSTPRIQTAGGEGALVMKEIVRKLTPTLDRTKTKDNTTESPSWKKTTATTSSPEDSRVPSLPGTGSTIFPQMSEESTKSISAKTTNDSGRPWNEKIPTIGEPPKTLTNTEKQLPPEFQPAESPLSRPYKTDAQSLIGPESSVILKRAWLTGFDGVETPDGRQFMLPETAGEFKPAPPLNSKPFKEFIRGSKVVDKDGNPLPVFHGTAFSFNTFSKAKAGSTTGKMDGKLGFFFSDDPSSADYFASYAAVKKAGLLDDFRDWAREHGHNPDEFLRSIGRSAEGAEIYSGYLSLKHPLIETDHHEWARLMRGEVDLDGRFGKYEGGSTQDMVRGLKDDGYDGIVLDFSHNRIGGKNYFMGDDPQGKGYIAFDPEQFKSTANRGTYSPDRKRMDFKPPPRDTTSEDRRRVDADILGRVQPHSMLSAERIRQEAQAMAEEQQRHRRNSGFGVPELSEPGGNHGPLAPDERRELAGLNSMAPADMSDGQFGRFNELEKRRIAAQQSEMGGPTSNSSPDTTLHPAFSEAQPPFAAARKEQDDLIARRNLIAAENTAALNDHHHQVTDALHALIAANPIMRNRPADIKKRIVALRDERNMIEDRMDRRSDHHIAASTAPARKVPEISSMGPVDDSGGYGGKGSPVPEMNPVPPKPKKGGKGELKQAKLNLGLPPTELTPAQLVKSRQKRMTEAVINSMRVNPKAGVSSSYKVKMEDPTTHEKITAIFKPEDSVARREVAAFDAAAILGLEDLVPTTVEREVGHRSDIPPGWHHGSMQEWVNDSTVAGEMNYDDSFGGSESDVARAAAFDWVIGNTDRHEWNWVVRNKDHKIQLIDHGFVFYPSRDFRSAFWQRAKSLDLPIPQEIKDWEAKWPEIEAYLKSKGFNAGAISKTKTRLDELMDADTFDEVKE